MGERTVSTEPAPMWLHDPDTGEQILLAATEEAALAEARRYYSCDPVERVESEGWMADVGWDRENFDYKREFAAETGLSGWWESCLPPKNGVATKKLMPSWKVVFADAEEEEVTPSPEAVTEPACKLKMDEALAARDREMQRVEENADEQWKSLALEAIRQTCVAREEFHVDDVWEVGGLPRTREDRALGPQMLKAARMGWCLKTDRVRPSVRSHGSGKPVWRSLIFGKPSHDAPARPPQPPPAEPAFEQGSLLDPPPQDPPPSAYNPYSEFS